MTALTPVLDVQALLRSALLVTLGFAVAVGVGLFSLIDAVKDIDTAILEAVVPWLQDVPGLTRLSERLTDIGAIPLNYLMALALAVIAGFRHRHLVPAALVFGCLFGSHVFQNLTNRLVKGSVPTIEVIGAAGPYFSGGVMRVIILTGMVATIALPREHDRWVWRLAVLLGLVEALTRLVLGRHWPFDLVAAFPVGLGLLYIFRVLYNPWRPLTPTTG